VSYNGFHGRMRWIFGGWKTEMLFQNKKSRTVLITLFNEKSGFSVDIIFGSATIVPSGSITT
jgi:hypothetical protein